MSFVGTGMVILGITIAGQGIAMSAERTEAWFALGGGFAAPYVPHAREEIQAEWLGALGLRHGDEDWAYGIEAIRIQKSAAVTWGLGPTLAWRGASPVMLEIALDGAHGGDYAGWSIDGALTIGFHRRIRQVDYLLAYRSDTMMGAEHTIIRSVIIGLALEL